MPMKSLQDLDIFVRTADSGSLSATARALDLTPAAASAALKRLEAELGVTLFVRSTRSLRLTQERSEEHTSELQSHLNLVCRLLLEKKEKAAKPLTMRPKGL